MKRLPVRNRRLIALAVLLLLVVAIVVFEEIRFGALLPEREVAVRDIHSEPAAIFVSIDPDRAVPIIGKYVDERLGFTVPRFVLRRSLPHGVHFVVTTDYEKREVNLEVIVNPRRFQPVILRGLRDWQSSGRYREVDWSEAVIDSRYGAINLPGTVPVDRKAEESAWFQWRQPPARSVLALEGRHVLEGVFDNRDGDAYVATLSLLRAYGYELDEDEYDISLSTFEYVRTGRLIFDVRDNEGIIALILNFVPGSRNRMAVIDLKVAIDEMLQDLSERMERDHGLILRGDSEWSDDSAYFMYRTADPDRALAVLLERLGI